MKFLWNGIYYVVRLDYIEKGGGLALKPPHSSSFLAVGKNKNQIILIQSSNII